MDRPVPYIAKFSQTGVMTIGWDRTMRAYKEHEVIPETEIAVNLNILSNEETEKLKGRRRLASEVDQPLWF